MSVKCSIGPLKWRVIYLLATILFLLNACAANSSFPLYVPDLVKGKTRTVNVIIVVPTDAINANIEESSFTEAAGGGLLFAIIDLSVERSRQERVRPSIRRMKDSLRDFDIRTILKSEFKNSISQVEWLELKTISTVSQEVFSLKESLSDNSIQDILFVINVAYSFSSDLAVLKMSAGADIYPTSDELKTVLSKGLDTNSGEAIYKNIIEVGYRQPGGLPTRERLAAKWSENNGLYIKQGVKENAQEVAKIISMSL